MKKVEKIIDTVKRNFYLLVDLYFEKVNRLDLGGIISRENLKSNNPESIVHATAYQAVWNINLNDLLNEINKNGCKYGNFIDIGSGKGKACFYAYKRKITPNIIGVEFDIDLVKIALNNKKILNADNVNFIHEDASNYILPNENSIIFMFNPFDEIILKKFLVNNIRHFKHFNSILMYANDIHRDQLIEMGFSTAFRNAKRSISLYKYTAN